MTNNVTHEAVSYVEMEVKFLVKFLKEWLMFSICAFLPILFFFLSEIFTWFIFVVIFVSKFYFKSE